MKLFFSFLLCFLIFKTQAQLGITIGANTSLTKYKYYKHDINREKSKESTSKFNIIDRHFGIYYKHKLNKEEAIFLKCEIVGANSLQINSKNNVELHLYSESIRFGGFYQYKLKNGIFFNSGIGLNSFILMGSHFVDLDEKPKTSLLYIPLPDLKFGMGYEIIDKLLSFEIDARIGVPPLTYSYKNKVNTFSKVKINFTALIGIPTLNSSKKLRGKNKSGNKKGGSTKECPSEDQNYQ